MTQCPSCGGNCGGTKKTGCLYRSDGSLIMDNIKRVRELEAENAALKLDAEIGRELYRAAGELPEWFNVVVDMERGAATVKWYDSDGNDYEIDSADRSLAEQIKDAVDSAIEQDAARGEK